MKSVLPNVISSQLIDVNGKATAIEIIDNRDGEWIIEFARYNLPTGCYILIIEGREDTIEGMLLIFK